MRLMTVQAHTLLEVSLPMCKLEQRWTWVGSIHGLGWIGSGWVEFRARVMGWVGLVENLLIFFKKIFR